MVGSRFQERKKLERIFYSVPAIIILVLLLGFVGWGSVKAWWVKYTLTQELEELKTDLSSVSASRIQFEDRHEELSSEEGLEREARRRFNLGKPGEEVVVFLDPEADIPDDADTSTWFNLFIDNIKKLWPF